jgi:hypothetical protein
MHKINYISGASTLDRTYMWNGPQGPLPPLLERFLRTNNLPRPHPGEYLPVAAIDAVLGGETITARFNIKHMLREYHIIAH